MTNEELFDLLSFETDLESVKIVSETELGQAGSFIIAQLLYMDGELTVPFVHYEGKDWLFTPSDWQGKLPSDASEIDTITWRVDNTEMEGVIFEGLPMLSPWTPNPKKLGREHRKRIGEAFKDAREEMSLSIRDVEESTGISKNIICRLEAGRANATIATLKTIADSYG
ncbi:MAG: helix-turn-helix domain-containing protein, partial [Muribaculaceae bacterium]|nr:helix-turn-helix domain-containing protein [Muribaculaceae bacterium]